MTTKFIQPVSMRVTEERMKETLGSHYWQWGMRKKLLVILIQAQY